MSSNRDPSMHEFEAAAAEADVEYAAFLREGTDRALNDTRPALSSREAAEHMALIRAKLQAQLDRALAKDKGA